MTEHLVSARDFIHAGGRPTLREWAKLTESERAAMMEATAEANEELAKVIIGHVVAMLEDDRLARLADAVMEAL